jgi:hypothetical protein
MANRSCGWTKFMPAALVIAGWICFAAAVVTENPLFRTLFLVAARALPHGFCLCRIRQEEDGPSLGPSMNRDKQRHSCIGPLCVEGVARPLGRSC